jgi:hypothetical protein
VDNLWITLADGAPPGTLLCCFALLPYAIHQVADPPANFSADPAGRPKSVSYWAAEQRCSGAVWWVGGLLTVTTRAGESARDGDGGQ